MPILTTCPSCGRALRVPDNLIGANVRCPGCENIFRAEGDSARPAGPLPEPLGETITHIPSEAVREQPPGSETPPPLPPSPARTGIREEGASQSVPLPPPPEFDEEDEDDEEEIDRMEEIHRRRRRGILREEARGRVNAPGIGLIVTGVIGILAGFGRIAQLAYLLSVMPAGNNDMMMIQVFSEGGMALLNFVFGILIIRGAIKMRRLESYGLALTACILSIIPCSGCCILGLVFGIWGLVVLNDQDVKSSFMAGPQKKERPDRDGEDESRPDADLHVDEI
ncbi:MAG TPA: hypothetical protein VKS79_02180 [Gemmataceae bacterium]|nr:hypothetical protein [Gemmataceae bacterium]